MKRRKRTENQCSFLSAPRLWTQCGQDTTQAPVAVTLPFRMDRALELLAKLKPTFLPSPLHFPSPSCPPSLSFFGQVGCPHSGKSNTHTSTPTLGWILNSTMVFIFVLYGLVSYVSVEFFKFVCLCLFLSFHHKLFEDRAWVLIHSVHFTRQRRS